LQSSAGEGHWHCILAISERADRKSGIGTGHA
jgi:hypothetical protein